MSAPADDDVLARVARIPEGFVATYGDVTPGAPRHAGRVLASGLSSARGVPWWRVVRADGSLAVGAEQAVRLREEGVPFRGGRVDVAAARIPRDVLDA